MGSRIGIGIDFGTSNSAAAVFDGNSLRLVKLEEDSPILPSATYIDRALRTETGRLAIETYIADNVGRTVELIPEVIGEASLALSGDTGGRHGPNVLTRKIYGQPVRDSGLRGRLFRGTKRLLGREDVRRLMVFDHPFRLVALITPVLLRIRNAVRYVRATDAHGGCMGHPVNFEGRSDGRNRLALSRLGEAYRHAGFDGTRFFPEPVAAAIGYLHAHPGAIGTRILTVDFGGGTLDLSVLEQTGGGAGFRTLTTHGVALGGDRIDQRIFSELLFPLLGKGERWRRRGTTRVIETMFPFERYEQLLLNWAVTYMLSQNRYTTPVLDCIAQGGPARFKFRRLRDLIQQNYGYRVFQAIRTLKAELSRAEEAVLDIPEIDVEVRVTRKAFEALISDLLEEFEQAVDDTLARVALRPQDIDIVLRTGGSSLIPAVRRVLDRRFPGRVVEHDPFTGVASGLAIAHFYGLATHSRAVTTRGGRTRGRSPRTRSRSSGR